MIITLPNLKLWNTDGGNSASTINYVRTLFADSKNGTCDCVGSKIQLGVKESYYKCIVCEYEVQGDSKKICIESTGRPETSDNFTIIEI